MSAFKVSLEILPLSESKERVSDTRSVAVEGECTDAGRSMRWSAEFDAHRSRQSLPLHVGLLSVLVNNGDIKARQGSLG